MPLRGKGGGGQGTAWWQCQLVRRGDFSVQDGHAEPGRSQIQISLAGARTRRLSAATRSSLGCGGRRSRALASVPLDSSLRSQALPPPRPDLRVAAAEPGASALGAAVPCRRAKPESPAVMVCAVVRGA